MWRANWREIVEKIDRFEHATAFFFKVTAPLGTDYYGLSNQVLIPNGLALYREVNKYKHDFRAQLPPGALDTLDNLTQKGARVAGQPSGLEGLAALVCILTAIRSQVDSYMIDPEVPGKRLIERAFLHLQRLIVADEDVRAKWVGAYGRGEPACEALGSCHLLLHGIWGFKASAAGERTDLVLGDHFHISAPMMQAADAIALTEWKKATTPTDALQKAEQARRQADLYGKGMLAGFEIRSVRYLIIVSTDRLVLPDDIIENGITYRHINVAVNPATPSVAARS